MAPTVASLAEHAWSGETPGARLVRVALAPAAAMYGGVVRARNALYDAGWLGATHVPAEVISVGNLTVGGTGKTPTALWLAGRLAARGRRVAIVARGYGKRRPGVVVVGERGTALVSPSEGGDEAVMLAQRFAGPVVTGERRADAARTACERFGCDTIVLDDGFQHRALARDADLVLVAPGATRLLPAGPLREPLAGLRRARAVLAVGGDGAWPPVPPAPPGVAVFRARLSATALVRAQADRWQEAPLDTLRDGPVIAVAGIARPQRFVRLLEAAGVAVAGIVAFPDHHPYGPGDVAALGAAAAQGTLVTTEKDLVKLAALPGVPAVAAVRVVLEVEDGEALVERLVQRPG